MSFVKLKRVAPAAVLGLALLVAGCGSSTTAPAMGPMSAPSSGGTPSGTAPSTSATPATGPHNEADVLFALMMIPHHTQAIEMSDMLLAKTGIDPQVTALAQKIKAAQGPEVAKMTGWLDGWGEDPGMGGMHHAPGEDGMMTQADMDALKSADGTEASTLFLDGMIKHHTGAIAMAQLELDQGSNPDAKRLARAIKADQQAEITEMEQLNAR